MKNHDIQNISILIIVFIILDLVTAELDSFKFVSIWAEVELLKKTRLLYVVYVMYIVVYLINYYISSLRYEKINYAESNTKLK